MKNKCIGILQPQYQNEDAAREYIEKQRWPDGPICPHCGLLNEASKVTAKPGSKSPVRKGLWWCHGCEREFTVTIGSIFEDSHIPLHKWLIAIHLVASSKKGFSALQLMRNLEIGSYRSAWFMAHRIRWALRQEPVKGKFGGIVEMDETYVGGKLRTGPQAVKPGERPKDRPAGTSNKAAVVAVLQRGGPVRSHHVECVTAKTLKPIVKEMVKENAHLMTDSSNVLASAGMGFKHDQVNHSAGEYARREKGKLVSTNSVESYFAILKRGHFGVYHHWSKKYLGQYLREFDWRYNVRSLDDSERAIVAWKMTDGKRLMLKPPSVRKS
jgi:transposase-like protein